VQALKRKRVTQVGSGAYSIYLPKKWIDGWDPEQQKGREVDLHVIGGSLLVVPVVRERRYQATTPADPKAVCARLAAGYVRGANELSLAPAAGKFGPDCVAAAREFLRHLDERIQARVAPAAIGFRLQNNLPAPFSSGTDLLQMMASRLGDMLELAADCVEAYGAHPERVAQDARILVAMHEEDLSRLYLQALRLVATLELPLENVSDFQLLDLMAAELHDAGRKAMAVAEAVLEGHGVARADLAYPPQELARRMALPDTPPLARELVRATGAALAAGRTAVAAVGEALRAGGPEPFPAIAAQARRAHADLHGGAFAAMERLGLAEGFAHAAVPARLLAPAGGVLDAIARAADRAATLAPTAEAAP
jgi:phosphate uptake regulator